MAALVVTVGVIAAPPQGLVAPSVRTMPVPPTRPGPGEIGTFSVSGNYRLVQTDEGKKANLRLTALGHEAESGEGFQLGVNVHLRDPGAIEE